MCVLNIGTEIIAPRLFLDNCALSVLTRTRDLGIIVNDSLSPTAHVMDIISKAQAITSYPARVYVPRR